MVDVIIIIVVVGGQSGGNKGSEAGALHVGEVPGAEGAEGTSRQPKVDLEIFGHRPHSKPSPPGC